MSNDLNEYGIAAGIVRYPFPESRPAHYIVFSKGGFCDITQRRLSERRDFLRLMARGLAPGLYCSRCGMSLRDIVSTLSMPVLAIGASCFERTLSVQALAQTGRGAEVSDILYDGIAVAASADECLGRIERVRDLLEMQIVRSIENGNSVAVLEWHTALSVPGVVERWIPMRG